MPPSSLESLTVRQETPGIFLKKTKCIYKRGIYNGQYLQKGKRAEEKAGKRGGISGIKRERSEENRENGAERGRIRTGRRMCGRQGQQAAGTVAGGDKDRAGHRMCGAVGGGRAAAGEALRPMMRFAVRVGGGMRCGGRTHAQLPGIRTDGETRKPGPADRAG